MSCKQSDATEPEEQVAQEEIEKRENDKKVQEYNDSKYDLQYELKLQWEDLQRQRPYRATGKVSETTTVLPAEDFKLQWEDLRRKRLILSAETNETTLPLNAEPFGTSTAPNAATLTERVANPGAFAIPGSSRRHQSEAFVEQQDDDPLELVHASAVSGDREHQLELQLEALQRQRNALVRTLQNIGRADVIPEHIRKSAEFSSTGRKREKVLVSTGVFAAVISSGVIVLLIVLLLMHDPGTITRFNFIKHFNTTMKYNVTVKEKRNYYTSSPTMKPQAPTQVPPDAAVPAPTLIASIRPTRIAMAEPNIFRRESARPSVLPSVLPSKPPMVDMNRLDNEARTASPIFSIQPLPTAPPTLLASLKPTSLTARSLSAVPTPAPTTIRQTTLPTSVPTVAVPTMTVQPILARPTLATTATSRQPTPQPTFVASTPNPTNDCTSSYDTYRLCLASAALLQQMNATLCDACVLKALNATTAGTITPASCTEWQSSFCAVYETCQGPCQPCRSETETYASCKAGTGCSVDCVDITSKPTVRPSISPVIVPTRQPTVETTMRQTLQPTSQATVNPTHQPTLEAFRPPTVKPTVREPSLEPSVSSTRPTLQPSGDVGQSPRGFQTTLEFQNVPVQFRQAFLEATNRWDSILIGDLEDVIVDVTTYQESFCYLRLGQVIDDVYICINMEEHEGVGGFVGYGGPAFHRLVDSSTFPLIGYMW